MNKPIESLKSPIPLAVIMGGLVWLLFDSVALGIVAAFATLFLVKRDQTDDVEEE